ncbi:MAG: exopolysaccharide biosynthesis polyprenyl glycosylphosphotransferase [Pseudomonadota bacterium]
MTVAFDHPSSGNRPKISRFRLGRSAFTLVAMVFEAATIALIAIAAGAGYHWFGYGTPGNALDYAPVGLLVALVYISTFALKGSYAIEKYVVASRGLNPIISTWTFAFIVLIVFVFLTKSSDMVSRGWVSLFYATGLAGALLTDWTIAAFLQRALRAGLVQRRRVMVLGNADEIRSFRKHLRGRRTGVDIVSCITLPPPSLASPSLASPSSTSPRQLAAAQDGPIAHAAMTNTGSLGGDGTAELLEDAVQYARQHWIDDIVILPSRGSSLNLDETIEAFLDLPARIHIGTPDELQHRSHVEVSRIGGATTLAVSEPRTAFFHRAPKRAFDVVISMMGLILLAPMFLIIGLLIKLETPGPVFFRQRRHGFNQGEFRIWKFRSMSTMDDGNVIRQAEKNDVRVTKIGRLLRRTNIDELPQLINVLCGEMSLVGPRPHAVAHDMEYQRRIERYGRRLNVRPGITGWAQVNGYRGQTKADHEMRERISYDLYYIDNWSVAFDIYIIALTMLSPKAFKNAY